MASDAEELTSPSRQWSGSPKSHAVLASECLRPRYLLAAALLSVCYYIGVRAGFALTAHHSAVSLLWPTNALVLAALLLTPKRTWPLFIAAVLPAHLLAEMSVEVPLVMVLCWYVSNICEALIGAWCIRRVLGHAPRFGHFDEFLVFLLYGALAGPFLSSFLDAGFVALVGWRYEDYWTVWRTRMLSNTLATLTLVPLVVIWFQRGLQPLRRLSLTNALEGVALFAGLAMTSAAVFLQQRTDPSDAMFLYLLLPFLIWGAMRLDVSGISLCIAIVASFAITGVLQGHGPFSSGDPDSNAQTVQVFLIITTTSLMLQSVSLTELRRARHDADRQRERLQLALSAARMGTWDWDVGSDTVAWSPDAAERGTVPLHQVRWSITEMMDRIHADDRSRVTEAVAQALAGANHFDVEFRWVDGEQTRWVISKGKLDNDEAIQRILGVHMDVTDRKTQEMQMQRQRDQLAHLSRVAVLGELSGALAHELNQPLTAIMTNAQAAYRALHRSQPGLDVVDEALVDIIAEDRRAGDVIRRLRALFLRGEVEMQTVSVNDCVRDVLALEHSDFIARKITVDARLAPDLLPVQADQVQLQQVLLNLILNACDAMRENASGDRRLLIITSNVDDAVAIEVTDCGSGISNVDSIFEPFFTTKTYGLGLGLAICQTIIRTHRGRLWATNNEDRGATLHVTLPVTGDPHVEDSM